MKNEKQLRLLVAVVVAAAHILLLFFVAVNMQSGPQQELENAHVMKVTDLAEEEPPPPPPEEEPIPMVESIAETMIETEVVPEQIIVDPGTIITPVIVVAPPSWDDYLPAHKVSASPVFDEREILSSLVFPPIALRSGIEGRVILELFVDKNGIVQRIMILREEPQDRGFGEAAVKAFTGKRGTPAMANGEPVSSRYRYPVSFKIK
jgi:protein TonB